MTVSLTLPQVRGSYRFDAPLAGTNWFGVGGPADVLFKPTDAKDLADFLKAMDAQNSLAPNGGEGGERGRSSQNESLHVSHAHPHPTLSLEKGEGFVPITVIGVGSNLIVRDGGIEGVVIRLGRGFTDVKIDGDVVEVGAAVLDLNLARFAADQGRAGLEFLSGIPGTIGGALAMNGGAYGRETADVLIEAEAVTPQGEIIRLSCAQMHYSYRHYGGPKGVIFTRAWLRTTEDAPEAVQARIADIQAKRGETQPIRERTGGSTFKNPTSTPSPLAGEGWGEGALPKAWALIDAAGCRGLRIGGAQMSELHCNFMINTGGATAADLEALGEEVRARVLSHSGISLEWEIKRIGRKSCK